LNEEILKQATKSNTPAKEIDVVLNLTTKFGMGFSLLDEVFPSLGPVVFGHSGNYHYLTLFLIDFLRLQELEAALVSPYLQKIFHLRTL
jgi:hypothetical protein